MQFDPAFRDDALSEELWQAAMAELRMPPPGSYGGLEVRREPASAVPLFGQQLAFAQPLEFTLVYEGATLWMSDTPQERLMMLAATEGMAGSVLVLGGGLGMYPQLALRHSRAERITLVERHPEVAALLRRTLDGLPVEIVEAGAARFLAEAAAGGMRFDSCYIDIHPTIDPRWLPGLNWLRDQAAPLVAGRLNIWGYHWMLRELVAGLEREYLPPMRAGRRYADRLGGDLAARLPADWRFRAPAELRRWLIGYAAAAAWPLAELDQV
ncbi:MAG TPA: hypothetical protein VGE07_21205 [Herpetosiphonaceae bacterium]